MTRALEDPGQGLRSTADVDRGAIGPEDMARAGEFLKDPRLLDPAALHLESLGAAGEDHGRREPRPPGGRSPRGPCMSPGIVRQERSIELWPACRLRPDPRHNLLPPMEDARYQELKTAIAGRGVQEPLCVTPDGRVLCGNRRFAAGAQAGIQEFPGIVQAGLGPDQELAHMLEHCLKRRHLGESQRAGLLTRPEFAPALQHLEKVAHDSQVKGGQAGGKAGGRGRRNRLVAHMPQAYSSPMGAKTRDILARFAEVSPRLITDARYVWLHAPERMEPVLRGRRRPAVTSIARELRLQARDAAGGSEAGAREVVLPPQIAEDGRYDAELQAVVQASSRDLAFVWRLTAGEAAGATFIHRLADSRDSKGRAGPRTSLGRLLDALLPGPQGSKLELSRVIGCRRTLLVTIGRTGIRAVVRHGSGRPLPGDKGAIAAVAGNAMPAGAAGPGPWQRPGAAP